MPSIIVLVDAQSSAESPEITDFYIVNTPEGQGVIIFENEDTLKEVTTAVQKWANADGLLAANMSLDVDGPTEAVTLLLQMFPHLGQMKFLLDDDPFVVQMLEHVRRS